MAFKNTTVTYLQMFSWVPVEPTPPCQGVRVERLRLPPVEMYRQLYNGVGQDYDWTDRNRMEDEALRAVIHHPAVEIHRLLVEGQTAGFCELDGRQPDEIELAYFGLFRQFIGQGLGKFFLTWALRQAWSQQPRRTGKR